MNRYRYLLKNIGILTIANMSSKVLSFLLVPLYTSVLTTNDYGTYDLINTTVSLLIPILTLNLSEGMLRFGLDKKSNLKKLLQISLKYYVFGLLVLVILIVTNNRLFGISFIRNYSLEFILFYITTSIMGITVNYARAKDKIREVAISGILGTFVFSVSNLILLLYFDMGLKGYLISAIISPVCQSIFLMISSQIFDDFGVSKTDYLLEKECLSYSIPLIFNSIAWWVNSASDRYVVTYLAGVRNNGIYSMAYKIPSLLTLFNTVFNQAWILSSVKEFDEKDESLFFSNTYKLYNVLMVVICSMLILMNKGIALLIFKSDFFTAYRYSPFLLIAVVFGAISGYIGGIFSAVCKTRITAYTVCVGAIVNLVLNIVLMLKLGTIGAAIATMVSYLVVWIIRVVELRNIIDIKLNIIKDLFCYLILVVQAVINTSISGYWLIIFETICFVSIFTIYREQLKFFIKQGNRFIKGDRNNE